MLWTQAIAATLEVTKANVARFGDQFPHVSNGDERYSLNDNTDWTDGFWSGILWLSYQYTNNSLFRDAAVNTVDSFRTRMDQQKHLDHHDIGFLYSLSSKAQWMIEQDEDARALTLQAADALMKRWREQMNVFQAWGPKDNPDNGGRIIIDCLMNLPLLFWATDQTGDETYRKAALIHLEQSHKFLVRGDDSSYHTFYFDQETGDALRGGTHQGYRDGSTWTRGQAWGIYGFALAYRLTGKVDYLETSKRMTRYFLERLPEDRVSYWDFDAPVDSETFRDSSATAIAVCGILEMLDHLPEDAPERQPWMESVTASMQSLIDNYSTKGKPDAEGFLKHGSYYVRGGLAPDDYVIWGDYFYLEALMRLENRATGYWYEPQQSEQ
ncbi:glucuronyl hydrolase [Paenibacillaceae bacterium]|nr:glucuronyl hydrolase [Paenibacillaceae bacterium]